jgi:hypothetical protein
MTHASRTALAVSLLVVASGCSSLPGSPEQEAKQQTADRAERAVRAVELLPGNPPLENIIHVVATYGDVLSAEGDQRNGGATIELRTTAEVSHVGGSLTETRCYRLTLRKGTTSERSAREIDCPDAEPMVLPPATEPRRLPTGVLDIVHMTLEPLAIARMDAAAMKAAMESALPGVSVSVATSGEVIGVAALVAGPMERDCVYARVTGDVVETWLPPHVYEQPGEASCDGMEALSDFTRRAPH